MRRRAPVTSKSVMHITSNFREVLSKIRVRRGPTHLLGADRAAPPRQAGVFGQAGLAPSRCRLHAAEAGGLDRDVDPGRGDRETLLDDAGVRVLAEPHQAVVKSVQAPDVFRMLAGA